MVAPAYGWFTVEVDVLNHGINVLALPMTAEGIKGA